MIIVTGGAGFIGSNLVEGLNARGEANILVVDHLKNGEKMRNLADLEIADYLDRDEFLLSLDPGSVASAWPKVSAVFHLGACSATTEWDGQFMMRNNFGYSKQLLHWCSAKKVPFIYASSASVYGLGQRGFKEERSAEAPINMYAYSKFLFDEYVRRHMSAMKSQVVGLRYFNVYGPRESHKGSMASTAFHFNNQIKESGMTRLFKGTDGYADGEQQRDFIYVGDCVKANLWFFDNPSKSGIFNMGTGRAQSFNEMARAVIDWHKSLDGKTANIQYIDFPEHLKGAYHNYTQADTTSLRKAGYNTPFLDVQVGVSQYLNWMNNRKQDVKTHR
jgi:ADP-L-glycero-D-manno-heptose 6-epimerase